MENLNNQNNPKLKKCPYQVSVYGENSCELIYRTTYKGDWGDWDEAPLNNKENAKGAEDNENENQSL